MRNMAVQAPLRDSFNESIVIGIDLSMTATGICWGHNKAETLRFRNNKRDPKGDMRLCRIRDMIDLKLGLYQPQLVVIEGFVPYGTGSQILAMVHGVAREVLAHRGANVMQVSPSSLKKWAAGHGKATKQDMLEALPTGVDASKWDDNAVDAWWLRRAGVYHLVGEDSPVKELK